MLNSNPIWLHGGLITPMAQAIVQATALATEQVETERVTAQVETELVETERVTAQVETERGTTPTTQQM